MSPERSSEETMHGPRGGGGPLLAWACLQLILAGMLLIWSGGAFGLLFLNGAVILILLSAWNRIAPPPGGPRVLARRSVPIAILGVGVTFAVAGISAGFYLVLIGAELIAFAAIWLVRELLAERKLRR